MIHRKSRPPSDRVSEKLWMEIWKRDDVCVPGVFVPLVPCSGNRTVEHFWHRPGGVKGKRAPSDHLHLVASCWGHNVDHPPSAYVRRKMREYIARYYNLNLEVLLRGDYETEPA